MGGLARWRSPARLLGLAILFAALIGLITFTPLGQEAQGAAEPKTTAGFQSKDQLVLSIELPRAKGRLTVELLGADGKVIDRQMRRVKASEGPAHRFEFTGVKAPANDLRVRCRFGGRTTEVALQRVLLVKAHETTLSGSRELFAGTEAAFRIGVHGVRSFTETVPLPGSTVTVRLLGPEKTARLLHTGRLDLGTSEVRLAVPDVAAGNYKLEVVTKSALGEEKLERDVKVVSAPKVLLTTDKPLYQPGQLMRLRALALRPFDLKPASKADLVLEIEDAKGNKVFKRELKTSDYGIASADFQLADEVNNGEYRVRAILGGQQSEKTVTVKPYVLPKFKSALTADKSFYLPKETIKGELKIDYFFGKPVAGGKVKVTASTFDVAFKDFHTWEGKTDAHGHAKFEIKLPNYFVGLPLQKGNAIVKLEAKVTDTADHTETITRTFPVSDQPIRVSLLPEAGRLVPGLENRLFVAALYPDGSPAKADVKLWVGRDAKGKELAKVKTGEAGLNEITFTPKAEQFRQGAWQQRQVELLGGNQPGGWAPANLFDLTIEARDATGAVAKTIVELTSEPFGENVLLRTNKAIYKGGETLQLDVRTTAGMPTVYVDVIKSGQTLLTRWLDVRDGKASYNLDLPAAMFGALEVHAYQMLHNGEIIRDSRVVYVNPAGDLQVRVQADKDVYLPGAEGVLRFEVVDATGKPTPAALGIIIVDEAVYALQEMQPGLEKVYFTLQEELLRPQAQAVYRPSENLDVLIRRKVMPPDRQQIAQALLTAAKPRPPQAWHVSPAVDRWRQMEGRVQQIGWGLWHYANRHDTVLVSGGRAGTYAFRANLLDEVVKSGALHVSFVTDPLGGKVTAEGLVKVERNFQAERLASALTKARMQRLANQLHHLSSINVATWKKDGKWVLPEDALAQAAKGVGGPASKDGWGREIKLVKRDGKRKNSTGMPYLDEYELVSVGPDGKFGTADDLHHVPVNEWHLGQTWWRPENTRTLVGDPWRWRRFRDMERFERRAGEQFLPPPPGLPPGPPRPVPGAPVPDMEVPKAKGGPGGIAGGGGDAGGPAPPRLREYFPETLFWQPELITDERGKAELRVPFADSITTWRLTASASSRGGALGGTTAPLRVFQDFFVDIDLPVALTQNDEVAFPVAVYNYLKGPQTVTLDLQAEPWFELTDDLGLKRKLVLKAGEVTAVKFRVKVKKVGRFPLTVKALGTKMSDAVKRSIDVLPDGEKVEQVFSDRLEGSVAHDVGIPAEAIPDASRLVVKVYPGVMAQVLEGVEGLLRLPGG